MKKHIEVVAAIIIDNDKIFCTQRPNKGEVGLKWEFPGGKIEHGETKEKALIREIREELKSEIKIEEYIMTVDHEYNTFYLTMHAYRCSLISGELELTEHLDAKWMDYGTLNLLDWAEADLPIVSKLNMYKKRG